MTLLLRVQHFSSCSSGTGGTATGGGLRARPPQGPPQSPPAGTPPQGPRPAPTESGLTPPLAEGQPRGCVSRPPEVSWTPGRHSTAPAQPGTVLCPPATETTASDSQRVEARGNSGRPPTPELSRAWVKRRRADPSGWERFRGPGDWTGWGASVETGRSAAEPGCAWHWRVGHSWGGTGKMLPRSRVSARRHLEASVWPTGRLKGRTAVCRPQKLRVSTGRQREGVAFRVPLVTWQPGARPRFTVWRRPLGSAVPRAPPPHPVQSGVRAASAPAPSLQGHAHPVAQASRWHQAAPSGGTPPPTGAGPGAPLHFI